MFYKINIWKEEKITSSTYTQQIKLPIKGFYIFFIYGKIRPRIYRKRQNELRLWSNSHKGRRHLQWNTRIKTESFMTIRMIKINDQKTASNSVSATKALPNTHAVQQYTEAFVSVSFGRNSLRTTNITDKRPGKSA